MLTTCFIDGFLYIYISSGAGTFEAGVFRSLLVATWQVETTVALSGADFQPAMQFLLV